MTHVHLGSRLLQEHMSLASGPLQEGFLQLVACSGKQGLAESTKGGMPQVEASLSKVKACLLNAEPTCWWCLQKASCGWAANGRGLDISYLRMGQDAQSLAYQKLTLGIVEAVASS